VLITKPVPLISIGLEGFGGDVAGAAADCTTGLEAAGLGGGIMEKSPALASPPALIFATQFAMTGKVFPWTLD
jgi:hypothetical protein